MLQDFELKTGRLYWRPLGETSWIDFGNVLGHKKAPDLKRLTHQERRGGISRADADLVATSKWRYTLEFDEHFGEVVALQLLSLGNMADTVIDWPAPEYSSNFSGGVDGWVAAVGDVNIALTGNTDGINSENDWLKVERTSTVGRMDIQRTVEEAAPGATRRIRYRVYNPPGSALTHFIASFGGSLGATPVAVAAGSAADLDLFYTYTGGVVSGTFRVQPCEPSGVNLQTAPVGAIYYVKNIILQKKNAVFTPAIGRSFWLGYYAATVAAAVTNLGAALVEGTHYTIDTRTGMVTVEALAGAETSWIFNVTTPTITHKTLQRLSALLTRGTFKLVENDQHDAVPLLVDEFEGQVWVTGWGDDNLEDFNRYQVEVLFTP